MKRWIVCKLWNNPDGGGIEPTVSKYTDNFHIISSVGKAWVLVKAGVQDLTPIQADADCYVLPDLTMDTPLSTLTQAQRKFVRDKLEAFGVDVPVTLDASWTIRDFFRWLGRKHNAQFEPEATDVADF